MSGDTSAQPVSPEPADSGPVSAELVFVVVNDEEQYSIWEADRPMPAGWRAVGDAAAKDAALAWIEANWTDMRPRSLRELSAADPGRRGAR